eukprot:TRINITY_DN3436_c0_g1_i1.p1 TRINITY_DN3436_c0_g1~~TRINITY_DN3436_c0_g1_i1.p1  ORF type:complete len:229 (-),score=61.55 TRINITY_DN3436_c0_g1_i1:44-730(-)
MSKKIKQSQNESKRIEIDLDDLKMYKGKIKNSLKKLDGMIKNLPNNEKNIRKVEEKIQKTKENLESYAIEMRMKGVPEKYKKKKEEFQKELNHIISLLNNMHIKSEESKDVHLDLILNYSEQYKDVQLIEQGIRVQESIEKSLQRQLKTIEETKQIATETLIELDLQEEKLMKVAGEVEDIKGGIKFGFKQLKIIARSLMKDWVVRFFCLLILIALIVFVIVVFAVKK